MIALRRRPTLSTQVNNPGSECGRQAFARKPVDAEIRAKAYMLWIHICTVETSDPLPKVLLGNLTELLP